MRRLGFAIVALFAACAGCAGDVTGGSGGGGDGGGPGPGGGDGGGGPGPGADAGGIPEDTSVQIPLDPGIRPVDILPADRLAHVAARMPQVGDAWLKAILESPDTMWY